MTTDEVAEQVRVVSNMEPGGAYWAGYLAGLKAGRKEFTDKYDPFDVTTMPPSPAMQRMIEHRHAPRPQHTISTRYTLPGQVPLAAGRCTCGQTVWLNRDGEWATTSPAMQAMIERHQLDGRAPA